jgi:hypothetical protein
MPYMIQKLVTMLRLPTEDPDAHVHFHRGDEGHPEACHDPRCPNPRLTV